MVADDGLHAPTTVEVSNTHSHDLKLLPPARPESPPCEETQVAGLHDGSDSRSVGRKDGRGGGNAAVTASHRIVLQTSVVRTPLDAPHDGSASGRDPTVDPAVARWEGKVVVPFPPSGVLGRGRALAGR